MPDTELAYYLGIRFLGSEKSYYFSCPNNDFALGDLVVVMTSAGVEAGKVSSLPVPLSAYKSNLELKPILRKADERDIRDFNQNIEDAKRALAITRREIESLNLAMDLIDAYYSLDGSRITITYTSTEKRVDFRELLKVLASQLGCRIELRQIASRDKAKLVGGIGICGLPLCCTTFLNQFEGISIQRAKNQMLTLNIPKLSGHCGKLICCLTFEDDAYTEAKKEFPRLGTVINLDEGAYTVDAFNVLSRTVRLVNATHSDYKTFPLADVQDMLKGTYKPKVELLKSDDVLPSFGLEKTPQKLDKENNNPAKNQKNDRNQNQNQRQRDDRRRGHNHQGQKGDRNPQPQRNQNQNSRPQQHDRPQENGQNQNRNRNRHHYHRHGRGGNNGGNGNVS